MHGRLVDFNLIPVLRSLLRERNVSKAARTLGLTRSGTSAALRRLRTTFGDPLLVKVGHHMELTDRARQLIGPVEQVWQAFEQLFHPVSLLIRKP
jgi:DNA-binding transcriptional LysR family regulator